MSNVTCGIAQGSVLVHYSLLTRDWKMENLANGKEGCFPLSQNFRKFWAEVKWKGPFRFGPTVIFDRSVRSGGNVPFCLQKFSFPVPFHCDVTEISVET